MATPDGPAINPDDFNCETDTCPNPFRVVSLMVGDSTAHYHCLGCWMAWNAAVIQKLAELGMIQTEEPAPASAGA